MRDDVKIIFIVNSKRNELWVLSVTVCLPVRPLGIPPVCMVLIHRLCIFGNTTSEQCHRSAPDRARFQ